MSDNPFNLLCSIVLLKYVSRRRKTDTARSHSQEVTGIVAGNLSAAYILGNDHLILWVILSFFDIEDGKFPWYPFRQNVSHNNSSGKMLFELGKSLA